MARDSKYDLLFEPIKLGQKTMRNRFCQVPHCTGSGSEQPGFQARFRGIKAEGGWAAVFTEAASITPETGVDPYVVVRLWDSGDVRNLTHVCDRIHEHDSLAGVELWYAASAAIVTSEARIPLRGPAQIPSDRVPYDYLGNCKEMDQEDIREVTQMYVGAAKRARDAGFDLITIYMAHEATLLVRFLTPFYNRRTDEYGGSFENRARYAREVLDAVRQAIGDDCAVGVRFSVDTLGRPYGLGAEGIIADEEGHRFIAYVDDLVDYWDINVGGIDWGEDSAPSRTHAENHEKLYVQGVKKHTTKPVINVGRFTNPDTMVEVIRSGQCDIIGSARPSISDPFLPNKIAEGRLDEIRECIGCNICISRFNLAASQLICTQNATSGEEFRRGWHPEKFTKAKNYDNDVLVVGAGPAGMECAVVLGKRGMRRVHLVDSADDIGGCMRWIPQLPGLGEWARVVNYRRIQLGKLRNVEVILGTELYADGVLDYGAEIVVIATGSHWARDGINGATQRPIPIAKAAASKVLTPEQIMVEGETVGHRVMIFDTDGYFVGISLAEKFAREGHDVTLATPSDLIAPYTLHTLELPRLRQTMRDLGVRVMTGTVLLRVEDESAVVMNLWRDDETKVPVDSVVLATHRYSKDSLYRDLKRRPADLAEAGITGLYQIGDCVQPDLIAEAIFSGHRLAREIDSRNPAVALPYIRERRLMNSSEDDYRLDSPTLSSIY